jgi:mono/diheme cytochrome c family protein
MNRAKIGRLIISVVSGMAIMVAVTITVSGQYAQNKAAPKIDVSSYPPEVQVDYRVFLRRCSECHSVASSLKLRMSPVEWTYWVKQMEAKPSSHFNDKQAKQILDFLNYDEVHRKAKLSAQQTTGATQQSDPVAAGREFYLTHNCDLCHTIGGKGDADGLPLDDVGKRLTRDQLTKRMQERRAGTVMPPLAPETTDREINDLVEYLLTLKGR